MDQHFESRGRIILNDSNQGDLERKVISSSKEPTDSNYGFQVEAYQLDDETRDGALATVLPNSFTPPQKVLRDGTVTDYPFKGSGKLLILSDENRLSEIYFDENDPEHSNFKIIYEKGSYICWKAGEEGLEFMEVCSPPYKEGDLQNLNMEKDDVPVAFKEAFKMLTEPEK